jgi:hypothetical protein
MMQSPREEPVHGLWHGLWHGAAPERADVRRPAYEFRLFPGDAGAGQSLSFLKVMFCQSVTQLRFMKTQPRLVSRTTMAGVAPVVVKR